MNVCTKNIYNIIFEQQRLVPLPKKFVSKKHFNPEDQFQTTVLDEKWIKIFLRFSSSIWCDLRPTQYGSGVINWTNVESVHQNFKKKI